MKIVVAQLNPTVGALEANTEKILASIRKAQRVQANLVLFSELTICGYPPEDLAYHSSFIDAMNLKLSCIAKACARLTIIVGLIRRSTSRGEKHLHNSAAIIHDGKIIGFQDKCLLPTYDIFDERRYFEPGQKTRVWNIEGKKIGVTICEDIWQHAGYINETQYDQDPILNLKSLEPDLVLNLSASPYQFEKPKVRLDVCTKASKTLGCPVIFCCQVGANDQMIFDGYSMHVDKEGNLCHLGKGFTEDEVLVDLNAEICPCLFEYDPMKNLLQALILGTRDYFLKSRFKKACLGISGGIDSALVAYIAVKALGENNVLGVGMPSMYSSEETKKDAKKLAQILGIEYREISITPPFHTLLDSLKPHLENKKEDITEENLQARIRGILLMALSNKHGHIVLNAGNKSEMALGYATLYGDMCGGLGVIGDLTKTKVYKLCRYINALEGREIILESIIKRPPSAELSPHQIDLDALPEYNIVDTILENYIENHLSVEEISEKFSIEKGVIRDLVSKIHKAEYKRRQAPPILRVSKKSFGTGRRYPIAQHWI